MTKTEFYAAVSTWDELFNFCYDHELNILDDLMSQEQLDDEIEEDVACRECAWDELRDALNDLPRMGRSYYIRRGWLDYDCADEELDYWRDDVAEYADRNGLFDPEDEEDEEPEEPETDDYAEEPEPASVPSMLDILGVCQLSLYMISGKP